MYHLVSSTYVLYSFSLLSAWSRVLARTPPSLQVTAIRLPARAYNCHRVRTSVKAMKNVNTTHPAMNHCSTGRGSRTNDLRERSDEREWLQKIMRHLPRRVNHLHS